MTYADDIASDVHDVAYYVAFAGIETRFASEDMAALGVSGTYIVALDSASLGSITRSLDRDRHFVDDGSLSFEVIDDTDARALIRRRGGTDDTLATAVSSGATTFTLGSGAAAYSDSSTIYIGRETITLGTHTGSGTYTGCSRAQHGSTAAAHDADEVISDVPRHWYTRGVELVAVNRSTGTTSTLWYGSLAGSPAYVNGRWGFRATGRIHDLFNRPICSGFKDYRPSSTTVGAGYVDLNFGNAVDQYEFAAGNYGGFVRVDVGGRVGIWRFDSDDLTSARLRLNDNKRISLSAEQAGGGTYYTTTEIVGLDAFADDPSVTARQIDRVTGRLGYMALAVMRSTTGNSSVDILPGREPDAGGVQYYYRKRMGAGITSALIDSSSWGLIDVGTDQDFDWLDEEERLGDWMQRMLWRSGGYAYINSAGKLAWQRYAPLSVRGAVTTYDAEADFLISDVATTDDETDAPGLAHIDATWDPIERSYRRTLDLVWFDDAPIYGDRDQRVEYQSKSLRLGLGGESWQAVESSLDRVRARRHYSGRRLSYRLPWRYHATFVPGYRCKITDSRLPDGEGSIGVSARPVEVVSVSLDFAALYITVEFDELPRGWLLAPSGFVSTWTGASNRITFAAGSLGSDFGDDYGVDWVATVYDASASPPFSVSDTVPVTAVTSSTIDLSFAPSLSGGAAPAAGDLVVLAVWDDTGNENVSQGADVEDYAFGADSSLEVGTGVPSTRDGPRWG